MLDGIVIDVKLQLSKACAPIAVTLEGIVTDAKLLHPIKADAPIEVILDGRYTEVKLVQP